MRMSDWSSDGCSSDLRDRAVDDLGGRLWSRRAAIDAFCRRASSGGGFAGRDRAVLRRLPGGGTALLAIDAGLFDGFCDYAAGFQSVAAAIGRVSCRVYVCECVTLALRCDSYKT